MAYIKKSLTFIVIAASAFTIEEVQTKSISGLDVNNLVKSLQQQLQLEQLQKYNEQEQLGDASRSESAESDHSQELDGIDDKSASRIFFPVQLNDKGKSLADSDERDRSDSSEQSYNLDKLVQNQLDQLQEVRDKKSKQKKFRYKPNSLVNGPLGLPYEARNTVLDSDQPDLNDYSNVYLILNPDLVKKDKRQDKLGDLLSILLNSNSRQKGRKQQSNRYKGFVVRDNELIERRKTRDEDETGLQRRDAKLKKRRYDVHNS